MTIDVNWPGQGDTLWVVADRIRFLGGLPGSPLHLLEVEVPPGSGTPPHRHPAAEMFYVVSGELTVRQFPALGKRRRWSGPAPEMPSGSLRTCRTTMSTKAGRRSRWWF